MGQMEVQRHDVGWPLRRRDVSEDVDPDITAILERRDHVRPGEKASKSTPPRRPR